MAAKWDAARKSKDASFSSTDIESFSTTQKGESKERCVNTIADVSNAVVLLDQLEILPAFSPELVAKMDKSYGFGENDNAEIRLRFYQVALKSGPEYAESAAGMSICLGSSIRQAASRSVFADAPAAWVINKGRMKFCRPIFRLLHQQAPELAKKTFMEHKDFFVSLRIVFFSE